MKIVRLQLKVLAFLATIFCAAACNGPTKKEAIKEVQASQPPENNIAPGFGDMRCNLQDKNGNLWIGTRGDGLYKYDGQSFQQFTIKDGLDCNNIYCLLEDKSGKIWVGTEVGLCCYDGKTFTQVHIPLPKSLPPNKNSYYQTHWVYSMLQAKDGKLWFVTIDGVYTYDGNSFTLFPVNEAENGFLTSNDRVERILEDKDGNLWFGGRTNKGVFRYDGHSITNLKLGELIQNESRPTAKPHGWGWPQLQDKHGNIWFSNWGGVYRYDGKTFTGFSTKDGLTGRMFAHMVEDKNGAIWLSGEGLYRYDGKSFMRIAAQDKKAQLGGWSIAQDASGHLWVGTIENGLYVYNGKEFITYAAYKQ